MIFMITFTGCAKNEVENNGNECLNSGGEMREFQNSCVDSCDLERNAAAISCAFEVTEGCDCGPDNCWNGNSCESN